jgi:hypothetical protein
VLSFEARRAPALFGFGASVFEQLEFFAHGHGVVVLSVVGLRRT